MTVWGYVNVEEEGLGEGGGEERISVQISVQTSPQLVSSSGADRYHEK